MMGELKKYSNGHRKCLFKLPPGTPIDPCHILRVHDPVEPSDVIRNIWKTRKESDNHYVEPTTRG